MFDSRTFDDTEGGMEPSIFDSSASGVSELADVGDALKLLSKVDFAEMPGEQAFEALIEIETLRNRFDKLALDVAYEVERSGVLRQTGHQNVAAVLKNECRLPKAEAHRRATLARRLNSPGKLGPTAAAFSAGRISFAHAGLLGRLSEKREIAWAFDDAEETLLVPSAETDTFRRFELVCQRFYESADVTQGDASSRRNDAKQKIRVSPSFEGAVRVDGWLNTVNGEIVHNEFERLRRHLLDDDITKARKELGRDPLPHELPRTADQRSADALTLMAQRSASLGASPATSLPCVNVTIDYETFCQLLNEFGGLEATYSTNGVRRTESGVPISPREVVATLLKGHVRRVVFGPKGNILDFGRKTPFYTGALREAVMFRDETCVEPGCDIPARFCEIDHAQSRFDGGATSEANANVRCRFHNGRKGARSVDPIIEPESQTVRWFKRRESFLLGDPPDLDDDWFDSN